MRLALLPLLFMAATLPSYTPNSTQSLKLENYQLKAQLAQKEYQQAQQNFQTAVAALVEQCQEVQKENKWPDTVRCDVNKTPVEFFDSKDSQPKK